jgi:glycosyltransferase involved in cell wall biosynthesis
MVAIRLAAAQAALGCQVQIVSYRFPDAESRIAATFAAIPNVDQVDLHYLPPLTKPERYLATQASRLLEPNVDRADILHLHGVWDPIIRAVAHLADVQGKPFVLTPHGMLDPWAISQKELKKRIALRLGYRRMLNRAAFLHYLNPDERRLAQRLRLASPTCVLPNAIFLQEVDPLPEMGTFRASHPEFAGAKLILFLGRLHYKKGLDFLADAFAIVLNEFPDAHLIVAGPDDGARAPFESQIARLHIADRVHLVGPLYATQKLAALHDCDCFCLPSRQEGFSLAIIEAMACTTPVVISPDCHFPEVQEADAGLIAKLSPPDIAAALASILRDPAAGRRMGRNGRELVTSRFTWPKVASEMVKYYQTALRSTRASSVTDAPISLSPHSRPSPLRVLHVIQSLDPAGGGPPMIAARIAAAQAERGCQMAMISYHFPEADERCNKALRAIPNFENVRIHHFPIPTKFEKISAREARAKLESIIHDFDILHLHGVWDPAIYAAADVAARARKPYVVMLHGMLDPWSLSQKKLKKKVALALGYRNMLNRAAFLHCGNSDEVRLIENLKLTAPLRVVPNGIFTQEVDPLPPQGQFRARHPEFADSKFVLFLSRLHYKKGLDYLADAFAIVARELPDVRLVIAGPDEGARRDFESQIARLGVAARVHLVGPIYTAQKLAAVRDCDCFCLPSRQEGFSLAIIEALACARPVVISKACHFPEVKDAGAGIVTDLEPAQIAEGLVTVLRDPAAANEMGQKGRQLILARYTWPKIAEELIRYYQPFVPYG